MRIKGIAVSLLVLMLGRTSAVVAQTPAVAGDICPGELGAKVDAIANRAEFSRSRWGILIQPLSSTVTLYSREATKYFIPASNVKLLTTGEHNSYAISINTEDNLSCCFEIDTNHSI